MLALSACGGGGKTVKVAILAPLSGDVATFGESTRDGALLAIEEWNEKGGVNGSRPSKPSLKIANVIRKQL